ncbi:TPA: hypothetical protein JGU28_004568 [Salmonella enterica]|nr:hypothetical protein [Salmonella enterica]
MFRLKIGGELALLLGLKGGFDIQLGPFYDKPVPFLERIGVATSKSGIILSGMSNVIIGG